jgi:3-hydroxypropanoate dehydrogenase
MTPKNPLSTDSLDLLFRKARTYNSWNGRPVQQFTLNELYDLMKMGPTSANCCPLRITFVTSQEAKEKLRSCLMEGNIEKTMGAPVTAILAYDPKFYEQLEFLTPAFDAKSMFLSNPDELVNNAKRNATLQVGYFILAARSLGLDCGPMTGFYPTKVDEAFFQDTGFKSDILCNLGYGNDDTLYPRAPRLNFVDACQII